MSAVETRRLDSRRRTPFRKPWKGAQVVGIALVLIAFMFVAGPVSRYFSSSPASPDVSGAEETPAPPTSVVTLGTPPSHEVFVSPQGKRDGDGSREKPYDLVTALSATGPVSPGDTVWLRGGAYEGNFKSELRGIETAPIIVRQYPGERATIVGASGYEPALTLDGASTWYAGFEVTSRAVSRLGGLTEAMKRSGGVGVSARGPHLKLINLVVHNREGTGIVIKADVPGIEAYGNLVYYNGWMRSDGVGAGNGIAFGNQGSIPRYVRDNIVFSQFSAGVFAAGPLDNVYLDGNVLFNSGSLNKIPDRHIWVGPGAAITLTSNATYYAPDVEFRSDGVIIGYGGDGGCRTARLTDNYLTGSTPVTLFKCDPAGMEGNTFFGFIDPGLQSTFRRNSFIPRKPDGQTSITGTKVFVRPSHYEPGRGHIVIFNWDRLALVPVDLSAVGIQKGTPIEVRDAQNFFGPALFSGSYTGEAIKIPMRGLPVEVPLGEVPRPPKHTGPEFGVFVVAPAATLPHASAPPQATPSIK